MLIKRHFIGGIDLSYTESVEMYLETILILSKKGKVRSVDIARHMGFSKPTISEQMKRLRGESLVEVDENNHVHLTDKGKKIAERVYERHQLLTKLFMSVGVDEATATEDACRVEHYISEETFSKLHAHYKEKHR